MAAPTIGVLIEDHFDQTEFRLFNEWFPRHGYAVEYLTHLWGADSQTYGGNPDDGVVEEHVTVTTEVDDVDPADYAGIILIGAYAMDRLRYQVEIAGPRQPNTAPAVEFLRRAVAAGVKIGTICHSLWLFCADPALLAGRRVTCAHNIVCDVENAGAEVVYDGRSTADIVVDGNLVTARHPEVTERFMQRFVDEIGAGPGVLDPLARKDSAMPTTEQIRYAVQAYVDSFNEQDKPKFLGVLADDVVQIDPVGSPPNRGRDALESFWDGLYGQWDQIDLKIVDLIVAGDEAAMVFHLTQTSPGVTNVVDGIDVFKVDDGGRIAEVKGYADAGHIRSGG
jgi:putative intracellular protease/amidase/ketosteroid isomerase-like protein